MIFRNICLTFFIEIVYQIVQIIPSVLVFLLRPAAGIGRVQVMVFGNYYFAIKTRYFQNEFYKSLHGVRICSTLIPPLGIRFQYNDVMFPNYAFNTTDHLDDFGHVLFWRTITGMVDVGETVFRDTKELSWG